MKASFYSDTDADWHMDSESGFSIMKVPLTEGEHCAMLALGKALSRSALTMPIPGVMAEQATADQAVKLSKATWVTASSYRNDAKGSFVLGKPPGLTCASITLTM